MPNVSKIMTTGVQVIEPQKSLRDAARLMQTLEVGALPVCSGGRLLGMLTDRDITVRGLALGLDPDAACVSDVMTSEVHFCTEAQDADDGRRVPALLGSTSKAHGHGACRNEPMKIDRPPFARVTLPPDLDHRAAWARVWLGVDVPQPSPDVVPLPPLPELPPRPGPPEITEPTWPGQKEPVGEPTVPRRLRAG